MSCMFEDVVGFKYTFDESLVSDLFKDAHDFRPRDHWWSIWDAADNDVKQAIWDGLIVDLEHAVNRQREENAAAVAAFTERVNSVIAIGAGNRATALRWMSQDTNFYHDQDVEHWVWEQGILFTDEGKQVVEELKEIYML